ncbi:MAG: hypothetical protein IJQ10_03590 [Clostridia bacterium]|nr:hypothetical protein [Clostridia bacterium]
MNLILRLKVLKFKLMFASNFILSDEDRVDKISMKIINKIASKLNT